MERRQLLKSSLALVGGTFLTQVSFAKGNTIELSDEGIKPFRINFNKDKIKDLHRRIDNIIWPEMPFDTGWSTGTNDNVLKDLVKYWRYEYDWFKEQDKLNQLAHFKIPIEGEQMHFVQYKGSGQRQEFPLLLLHGWPSSFLDFTYAASILVNGINGQPGFDLIVPSLPGFAFSDAPKKAGIQPIIMAKRMNLLMEKLGFKQYGVAGIDWGNVIGDKLAFHEPKSVIGLHSAGAPWSQPPSGQQLQESETSFIAYRQKFDVEETAYSRTHGYKPQTLAYALQDSPVGFLSWILEKYWSWSDHNENLWETFDRNKILNTAMLYWLNGRILSASRIYYEFFHLTASEMNNGAITVPIRYARFPKDPWGPPPSLVKKDVYVNLESIEMTKGGHFPAMEVPKLWATDVATFFSKIK